MTTSIPRRHRLGRRYGTATDPVPDAIRPGRPEPRRHRGGQRRDRQVGITVDRLAGRGRGGQHPGQRGSGLSLLDSSGRAGPRSATAGGPAGGSRAKRLPRNGCGAPWRQGGPCRRPPYSGPRHGDQGAQSAQWDRSEIGDLRTDGAQDSAQPRSAFRTWRRSSTGCPRGATHSMEDIGPAPSRPIPPAGASSRDCEPRRSPRRAGRSGPPPARRVHCRVETATARRTAAADQHCSPRTPSCSHSSRVSSGRCR